ncbi:NAD(P)H-dependent flavin oxidoreductase [Comamonas flocculans]|uniref:Nitronate monooxygenase n=1 Tax=Comamonas flocculans TaxID=2597701 RepID=A0A5B8RTT7_9BURK|nr:nitronate monooxygenase [Comamonas flocculans]QEA12976.1 nitronate monooxygenase [Comamonas flocculans]
MTATPHLLQRIGITLPIIQAPMTGSDTPRLAAAVSRAGGLGSLGCGARSPAAMREAAAEVRGMTDRPFAMNLFVLENPAPEPAEVQAALQRLAPLYARFDLPLTPPARWCQDFDAQWQALLELRPAVASFTFGLLSAAQVEQLHRAGCLVVGTATTVAEALAWQNVGADAVVASGVEGGGHRGTFLAHTADDWTASQIGTMALVPACVDALSIPVIAAGGIMDGRGIAAALALGAQAAQLGTAFLACPESALVPAWREALAQAQGSDTRLTRAFSGRWARGIVNAAMRELGPEEDALPAYPIQNALMGPVRKAAAAAGDGGRMALWAGQGVGASRVLPARELVEVLEKEWRAA